LGEELPEEKDIKAFLVSSNMDVRRCWVKTTLVRDAASARQKIALILTYKNTDGAPIVSFGCLRKESMFFEFGFE